MNERENTMAESATEQPNNIAAVPGEKLCFVICPIGPTNSDTRTRSDKVYRRVIKPIAEKCGYKVHRADFLDEPGLIGNQVISYLIKADLVIADLTDLNPNVMYELAVRHLIGKPTIHLMEVGGKLPFDIQQQRTIFLDHRDLDSAEYCKQRIAAQIRAVETDPKAFDNPITVAAELSALKSSDEPLTRVVGELVETIQTVLLRLDGFEDQVGRLTGGPFPIVGGTLAANNAQHSTLSWRISRRSGHEQLLNVLSELRSNHLNERQLSHAYSIVEELSPRSVENGADQEYVETYIAALDELKRQDARLRHNAKAEDDDYT